MKRRFVVLLLVALVAAVLVVTRPPRARSLAVVPSPPAGVRGAVHVHTRRSDGSGMPDAIAAAASRAGLKFVILTDHDDAASEPTAPYYRSGVLLIEGAEISTDDGHVVALGLPRSPYPLGGESRDVIEDVHRLGGFAIAAHPASPKAALAWRHWDEPFDGLEWLNADSEWRDESIAAMFAMPVSYALGRVGAVARLFDRPDEVLTRWDELTTRRQVVGLAAADAHARIGLRSGEPDDPLLAVHLPSYEALFSAFSITVAVPSLSGGAGEDATAILAALRAGHVYSSIDAIATPVQFSFAAVTGTRRSPAGDVIGSTGREIELLVESNAPQDARVVLLQNGREVASGAGSGLRHVTTGERATYRAEVHLPGAPGTPGVPWIVSNPIYVGLVEEDDAPARPLTETAFHYQNGPAAEWRAATSDRSRAVLDVVPGPGGTQLSLRYGLGGTRSDSPYAALVAPAGTLKDYDRVVFTARASQPMRLSVQIRVPTGGDGERWHRSVYLDPEPREITVFFDDMRPRGQTSQPRPDLSAVHALMFVVDTVNTRPGSSGQFWIDDVRYGR
jgi:hypothetical protein